MLVITLLATLISTCSSRPSTLNQILDLGEIRVITRNTPTTYFVGPNGPEGPEYDLVQGFADHLGVDLVIETVDNVSEILPRLSQGEAHMAALSSA